jgi:VanZ family protein
MDTAPVMPELPMSNLDKLAHLLMFLTLSGSVFFDNTAYFKQRITKRRIILGSFLFPLLFSGLIEIIQEYFSSVRSGDWMDFLFDGIGTLIGILICFSINSKLKFPPSPSPTPEYH